MNQLVNINQLSNIIRKCCYIYIVLTLLHSTYINAQSVYSTPYTITTLAGSGNPGYTDGQGSNTAFSSTVSGIALDSQGNLIVADGGNNVIRKITPLGIVSTIAGTAGQSGSSDGPSSIALFGSPCGLTIDSTGNIYVSDTANNTIRKLTPSGNSWNVTTVVQTSAGLNQALALTCDSSGNIYIADSANFVIRKYSPSGTLTTFAGKVGNSGGNDGSGSNAQFAYPTGICSDANGNLYVADYAGNTIRKINPSGTVTTYGGQFGTPYTLDGALTTSNAQFNHPNSIACDAYGNLYITEGSNGTTIRQINSIGIVSTLGGSSLGYQNGIGSKANFAYLRALVIDASKIVYLSDSANGSIRKGVPPNLAIAPTILAQPTNATSDGTTPITLSVSATGSGVLSYQWFINGISVTESASSSGTQTSTLKLPNPKPTQSGTYTVIVTNTLGSITSTSASVIITQPQAPRLIAQPQSIVGTVGGTAIFSVTALGNNVNYQWFFNAMPIAGANSNIYTVNTIQINNAGFYFVTVSNSTGSITSSSASLTIANSLTAPVITAQPSSQTISFGASATLSVTASGNSPSYQWYFNGNVISGATSSSYTISSADSSYAGSYTVSVTNSAGSVTSSPVMLTVTKNQGRLINLSVLSLDGPGTQLLTLGFVTGGAGTTGSQNLLIRASGPSLTTFGVINFLVDPTLNIFNNSSTMVASNDNWGTPASNALSVTSADSATGAFALTNTSSFDAALVATLSAGGYSAQVAGKNGASGNVLAEVYDATPTGSYTSTTPRLVNLSCLEQISKGGILSIGFVVGGNTSEQVLIRASGPTIGTAPFNVLNTIPDPKLTIYNSSSAELTTNTGWGGDLAITAANKVTGAFQFNSTDSKDSAVLLILQPGAYTVQASSASGISGVTLIEVYEVPTN